jgi:hypothetical protein
LSPEIAPFGRVTAGVVRLRDRTLRNWHFRHAPQNWVRWLSENWISVRLSENWIPVASFENWTPGLQCLVRDSWRSSLSELFHGFRDPISCLSFFQIDFLFDLPR